MIVLVCGGRTYNDYVTFEQCMNMLPFKPSAIVHGGAKGADSLADTYAKIKGIPVIRVDALWNYHGNKAGILRNQSMLDFINIGYVVAFPGGTGTGDMIRRSKAKQLPVWEIL